MELNPDLIELLAAFKKNGVKYLIIGGITKLIESDNNKQE